MLPQLAVNDRFNPGCVTDRGPYLYWYRAAEIEDLLRCVGFTIERVGTREQVHAGRMVRSVAELGSSLSSQLYLVVRKPGGQT